MLKFGKFTKESVRYLASGKYVDLTPWRSLIAVKEWEANIFDEIFNTNFFLTEN